MSKRNTRNCSSDDSSYSSDNGSTSSKKNEISEHTNDCESSDNSTNTKKNKNSDNRSTSSEKNEDSEHKSNCDSSNDSYDYQHSKNNKKNIKKNTDEYSENDLRNIIFEDIDKHYAYGKLGPFNVVIMKKNGYINATKLCKDACKEYRFWAENKSSRELIDEVKLGYVGILTDPIIKILTGDNFTRGTYVHHDLIIHIASWCSAKYAIQVSKIVVEYHAKNAIEEKNKLLKIKDDKIDKMSKKIDILLEGNEILKKGNDKLDKKVKQLLSKNNEIYEQNENLFEKLDDVCNDRVVHGKPSESHMLLVIKNNDDDDDDAENICYEYTIKRVMKKSHKQIVAEHNKRHPNMEILLRLDYSPNAINLWNRIKTELKSKIKCSGCNVNLRKKYSERKFLKDIKNIHDERFDHDNY